MRLWLCPSGPWYSIANRLDRADGAERSSWTFVDAAQVGLSDFWRPEGFLARQVRRWKKQLDASRSREVAGVDELHHLLEANLPVEGAPAVVHGDLRLDNLLVDEDDQVVAVVDWDTGNAPASSWTCGPDSRTS